MYIYYPRLPKLATDQTASIGGEPIEAPDALVIEHLRKFRDGNTF
jgi:hypothetical protein